MATEQDMVIATLDAKIEELQMTLDALRRTRAFFVTERERQGIGITQTPADPADKRSSEVQPSPVFHLPTQPTKSIGMMIVDTMNDVGRPMHVDELMPALKDKGSQASRQTVIGTLARYTKERKLRRVAPNTYAMKKLSSREENAGFLRSGENGAPNTATQSMQPGTREYECYTILKARGAFMDPREMLDAMIQSGIVLNTPKPLDLIGGVMRQSIRRGKQIFVRDNQGRFGLQEWKNLRDPIDPQMTFDASENNGANVNVDLIRESEYNNEQVYEEQRG